MIGLEGVGPLAPQYTTAALNDVLPECVVPEVVLGDVAASVADVGDGAAGIAAWGLTCWLVVSLLISFQQNQWNNVMCHPVSYQSSIRMT